MVHVETLDDRHEITQSINGYGRGELQLCPAELEAECRCGHVDRTVHQSIFDVVLIFKTEVDWFVAKTLTEGIEVGHVDPRVTGVPSGPVSEASRGPWLVEKHARADFATCAAV